MAKGQHVENQQFYSRHITFQMATNAKTAVEYTENLELKGKVWAGDKNLGDKHKKTNTTQSLYIYSLYLQFINKLPRLGKFLETESRLENTKNTREYLRDEKLLLNDTEFLAE